MDLSTYHYWAQHFTNVNGQLVELLFSIPFLSLPQRKVVLDFSRIQPNPIEGSRYHRRNDTFSDYMSVTDLSVV